MKEKEFNELNKESEIIPSETEGKEENKFIEEIKDFEDKTIINEYNFDNYIEKNKTSKHKNIVSSLLATAVVGSSILILPSLTKEKPIIENIETTVGGTYYVKKFDVINLDEIDLYMKVHNGSYEHVEQIDEYSEILSIDNLKNKTTYTFSIYGSTGFGKTTFYTDSFTTTDNPEKPAESFYINILSRTDSENLYLKLEIIDELSNYENYVVRFINDEINVLEIYIYDINAEYEVNVYEYNVIGAIVELWGESRKISDQSDRLVKLYYTLVK